MRKRSLKRIFREEGIDGLTAYYNHLKHHLEWKESQHEKEIEDIRDEMSDVLAFRQKKIDEDCGEDED